MALNAVDGMLAREFHQKSTLGAFLNELTDVISDAALYLPFAIVAPFEPFWVAVVIMLAGLSEFAGALGTHGGRLSPVRRPARQERSCVRIRSARPVDRVGACRCRNGQSG